MSKPKHNDVMVRHTDLGAFAYICKHRSEGTCWEMFVTDYGDYLTGMVKPRYPVPATELDGALAATPERVSFLVKAMLLKAL